MTKEKLAILVGGGPAPGINSVISAATIRALLEHVEVVGIRGGFDEIMHGRVEGVRPLTVDDVSRIHFRGGSVLGTSRANPTAKVAYLDTIVAVLQQLGVSQLITGLVILVSDNRQMTGAFSDSYKEFARGEVLGIPILVVYLLVLAAVVWFVLEQTPLGRRLYATGGNAEAARLAGVRTDRLMWGSLVTSALLAGLAGVLFSMKVGTFSSSIGPGYLFPAVAAVFFGASQFSGRPNVWGTVVAYFSLAFGIKGLQLVAGPGTVWIGPVFEGAALVLAVALASQQGVLRARRLARAEEEPSATTPAPVTTTEGDT